MNKNKEKKTQIVAMSSEKFNSEKKAILDLQKKINDGKNSKTTDDLPKQISNKLKINL